MSSVTVIEFSGEEGDHAYIAVCGDLRGNGKTPGAALDAVASQRSGVTTSAVVLFKDQQQDEYFSENQRERLSWLMERWRMARDGQAELSNEQVAELESLISAELAGAEQRAKLLADAQTQ